MTSHRSSASQPFMTGLSGDDRRCHPMIVVYASSHGWGHNMRLVPILNELFNYRIELVTTAPDWLIQAAMTKRRWHNIEVRHLRTDPGCVQSGPFTIDVEKTIEVWSKAMYDSDRIVQSEVELMKKRGNVRMIISDISFIGQLVAEQIGVPSVCIATFDWQFIHRDIIKNNQKFREIMEKVQTISEKFDYCLIPGPKCEPLHIGKEQISFHWASRKPRMLKHQVREKLGLSLHADSVLLSFGGHAIKQLPQEVWTKFDNFEFFVLVPNSDLAEPPAPNVHFLPSEQWSSIHTDLVNTVDVVMGKIGYGLVSEVLHCKSKFLVVERKGNPESETLTNFIPRIVPYAEITEEQFLAGEWSKLNELVETERNEFDYEDCPTDGEVQIARWIRACLGDREPLPIDPMRLVKWFVLVVAVFLYFFIK